MGFLRRYQGQRPPSPAGSYRKVGVRQPDVYNNSRHNFCDYHKYHDAGVRIFTFV